ncbi:MAG: glycerate kinase [Microcoleaceae cyanobacterium]
MTDLLTILEHCQQNRRFTDDDLQILADLELANPKQANIWGITAINVQEKLQERSHLFLSSIHAINQLTLPNINLWQTAWQLWLPLALQIVEKRQQLNRVLIQGILGGQGTGKTTLGKVLTMLLAKLGYHTVSLSLDDLYKTYSDRQILQKQDPRLIWRGPPGTHDVDLGIDFFNQCQQLSNQNQVNITIPRFDKSLHQGAGDRTTPEIINQVDIVLFEGWFVGVYPIDINSFASAPWPINTEADRQFARDINTKLKEYLPLWQKLDQLMILHPIDYRLSLTWRKQAEQEMIAQGKSGMTETTIEKFVQYFWQALHPLLFITPLLVNHPHIPVNLIVEILADHSFGRIYRQSQSLP